MSAGIELRGLATLVQTMGALDSALANEMRQAQAQARGILVARLTNEPPPPPSSTYQRTGEQSRGWNRATPVATQAGGLQLFNPVEHAKWTQEAATQAWMHQGRWETTEQVAQDEEAAIQQLYEDAAIRAATTVKGA